MAEITADEAGEVTTIKDVEKSLEEGPDASNDEENVASND